MENIKNIAGYYPGNIVDQKHSNFMLPPNTFFTTCQKITSIESGKINGIDKSNFDSVCIREFKLLSCGFQKSHDKWTKSNISLKLASWNKYDVYFLDELLYSDIEYMHEIQNIYSIHLKRELDIDSLINTGY